MKLLINGQVFTDRDDTELEFTRIVKDNKTIKCYQDANLCTTFTGINEEAFATDTGLFDIETEPIEDISKQLNDINSILTGLLGSN